MLVGGPALAMSCSREPRPVWPTEIADVPRNVHPVVLDAAVADQMQLFDAGPMKRTDGLTFETWEYWQPVPADARKVRFRVRPIPELGSSPGAVELVPEDGPLPANHRFLYAIGWHIQAAFATGERIGITEPVPEPPRRFVILETRGPSIHPLATASAKDATLVLRLAGPTRPNRLLVISVGSEDRAGERFLALTWEGKVFIGASGCGHPTPRIDGPGRVELVLREWGAGRLSPPVRVGFQIPAPVARDPNRN